MDWFLLMTTAFTVSIDSFVCGFSLSSGRKKKFRVLISVTLSVFLMCAAANIFGKYLEGIFSVNLEILGGIILIGVGVYNILRTKKDEKKTTASDFKEGLTVGFAIGTDGAAANFSLALMGMNSFIVPLTFTLMHIVLITSSILLSKLKFIEKLGKYEIIPSFILIALGLYKFIRAFF